MKNDIVLYSTNKGYFSMHFWGFAWIVAFWILNSWCEGHIQGIGPYDLPWPHVGVYGSYVAMIIIGTFNFYVAIYKAKEVNVLMHGEQDYLEKITCHSYGFPFSKNTTEAMFNRVIKIEIEQGSLERLLDTGSLNLKLVTFTSADSHESSWVIPAINNPFGRKKEIEESLLSNHEGLMIKK